MSARTHRAILEELHGLIEAVVGDAWDRDLELSDDLSLLYDLGLESVEVIAMLEQLRGRYGFPIERVLRTTEAGTEVSDLSVRDVVAFVTALREGSSGSAAESHS